MLSFSNSTYYAVKDSRISFGFKFDVTAVMGIQFQAQTVKGSGRKHEDMHILVYRLKNAIASLVYMQVYMRKL